MTKTAEIKEFTGRLAELVQQVQAGNEVVLTEGDKPVAKIISTAAQEIKPPAKFQVRSFKGHRVRISTISQSEIADEMFGE